MKHNNTNTGTPGCEANGHCGDAGRRAFLRAISATAAALAVGACSGSATETAGQAASPSTVPPATPQAPVWQALPTIAFTQGVAASFSIAGFVSDANGDALTITKNSAALPAGVTYDAANKRFVYDGVGAVGATGGHVLTADDGHS